MCVVICDRRDAGNPTFRRVRLGDIDFSGGAKLDILMENGPAFVDVTSDMN